MTTSRHLGVVALAFAALTAACGGSDSSGPSFADSVSTTDAADFADDAIDASTSMAWAMDFGGPSIGLAAPGMMTRLASKGYLASKSLGGRTLTPSLSLVDLRAFAASPAGLQASAAEGCTYTVHGLSMSGSGFVDVNQNDIPDDLYLKIDCITTDSTSNPDTTYVLHLMQEQAIKENFSALHGFSASFHIIQRNSDEFGNFEGIDYSGNEALDIRSGSATHNVGFGYDEGSKFGTDEESYTGGAQWNGGFDPDGAIVLGDPLPDGALSFTGREFFTNSVTPLNLSFGIATTTPLAYKASCAAADSTPPFTSGVVRGRLNNNAAQASFQVTFTGCGGYDVTYSGTTP